MRARLLASVAALLVSAGTCSPALADEGVQRFVATLSVSETLAIAAANPEADTRVRLLLRGGGSLEGAVRAAPSDKASVVLAHRDGSTSVARLDQIASVTVIDPGAARIAFQGNRIFMEATDAPPTPLAFRRLIAELDSGKPVRIATTFSDRQIESGTCRFYADKVLSALASAVSDAGRDTMGLQALATAGNAIEVRTTTDAQLEMVREASSLALIFDCEAPLPANYASAIRTKLEGLL
ncbi:MAG: hypothetical protein ACK4KV_22185 [Rhodocyclaceae bacterium]